MNGRTASETVVFRPGAQDSFGRYHDIIATTGAASSQISEAFEAAVTARNAPGLMLFDRQVIGVEHHRKQAHIRQDGFEHFYLQVLRSGMLVTGAPGDERWFAPGDAVLMDATRPQRTVVHAADYVTVVMARPLVEAIVPEARRLHGRRIPRSVSRGLGRAVLSLAGPAGDLEAGGLAGASRMIADILAEVAGRADVRDDAGMYASQRLRVGLFIEAHLGRQGLDADTVARGVGMSRSALYRAFQPVGGIAREIVRRRVARLRSVLLQPSEKRSLDCLAWNFGFSSISHCSRVFKDAYGMPPGMCRAEARDALRTSGAVLRDDDLRERYGALASQA